MERSPLQSKTLMVRRVRVSVVGKMLGGILKHLVGGQAKPQRLVLPNPTIICHRTYPCIVGKEFLDFKNDNK